MKKTILLFIISFACTAFAESQTELQFFAKELCKSFEVSDLKKSKEDLFKLIQTKSNGIYTKHPEKLNALLHEFKEKNPDKSQNEIVLLMGQQISLLTVKDCPTFRKITQKIAIPEPKTNKESVVNVSNEMCELLNNSSDKSAAALNKIVDGKLFDLVFKNKELIEKDYGSFGSAEYKNDLNVMLMSKCDIYYKLVMGEQ